MKKLLLFVFLALIFPFTAWAAYPQYSGYVNDFSHVLSGDATQQIEKKLSDFDKRTTNQIAVITVDTTQPETLAEYSIHLADQWKVGQKGKDNGVIMLFSMKDRQMRIEVGRGLEGDLTDIQSKHILDDVIRPEFQKGDYATGIDKGTTAVMQTITPHGATPSASIKPNSGIDPATLFYIGIILFIIFSSLLAHSPYTPLGGQGVWGFLGWWVAMSQKNQKDDGGDGFGGFGGGGFSGGGSSSNW